MTSHPTEELLNDFVDETLPEADASGLRRHLEVCPDCRSEILALRRLRTDARELPRGRAPGRDLWPEIRSAIETERGVLPIDTVQRRVTASTHPLRRYAMSLASAAAALMVLASAATIVLLRPAPNGESRVLLARVPVTPEAASVRSASVCEVSLNGGGGRPAGLRSATESYEKAAADLMAAFEARKSQLRPSTVATVERNLKIVDDALMRACEALETDPANPALGSSMTTTWQRKVDLLNKAVRLTSDL